MTSTLLALVLAAALEMGGDAAVRHGLVRAAWPWLLVGGIALVAYGFAVNVNRTVDFGRLIGLYIAVLFVVSQTISVAVFGEHPSPSLLAGGALIVTGGLVIQFGAA
jgi:drug/metabolite transporter superfamily protein YnfA